MPRTTQKPIKDNIDRPYAEIGERIKAARTKAGLDQKDIVDAGAAGQVTISLVERGIRQPSVELLRYLRVNLNADLNIIIAGE